MKGILHFAKMEGCGNDFIIIDDSRSRLGNFCGGLAKKLCHRKYSIGADGLLILKKGRKGGIKMKYYNSDGSLADFCGNGARCISQYAYKNKIVPKKFLLESDAGSFDVYIKKDAVKLAMADPADIAQNITLEIDGKKWTMDSLDTGVPHAVMFLESYRDINVDDLGRKIRMHKYFQPAGANVNFIVRKSSNLICIRTYERGVEAETLACGTGAVASSVTSGLRDYCSSPVKCKTAGGEILTVYFKKIGNPPKIKNVYLEGPANISFEGEVKI